MEIRKCKECEREFAAKNDSEVCTLCRTGYVESK